MISEKFIETIFDKSPEVLADEILNKYKTI
jgi:hypothetical protein